MKKGYAYSCLLALLTLFSCEREREDTHGGIIDIHFSTAELQVTKATTPGDGRQNDGGGFTGHYMNFEAPDEGTLKLWASSIDGTSHTIGIIESATLHTEFSSGTGTSRPADGDAITLNNVAKGPVTLFPSDGASRFYKISFTYTIQGDNPETEGETETSYEKTLSWDFGNAGFMTAFGVAAAQASALTGASYSLDVASVWSLTVNGLTIWSTVASTWNSAGYFDWGSFFSTNEGTNPVDLVILIADNQPGSATRGNIVATYPSSGRADVVAGTPKSQSAVDAVVSFDFSSFDYGDADSWDYTVYAFGNTDGLWDMTTDGENTITNLTSLTTVTDVENLKFKVQERHLAEWEVKNAGDDTNNNGVSDAYEALANNLKYDDGVVVKNGLLPVSAKASLTVSSGRNGEAYLELLRCVAKVTARIVNNTGSAMNLYDYKHTVHGINPDQGYVIPHTEDIIGTPANLVANPCAKYNMPSFAVPITEDGSMDYDWYVFPSNGPYTICLQFTLNKGEENQNTYTYNSLPITDWRAQDIPALGRNQHLIVTTRISRGLTVSFNFEVVTWEESHSASVSFD